MNRSILLNLLRRRQPLSRAELSEITGIYRSSISEIVEELLSERLLVERRSVPRGRGRVPIQLTLNPRGFRVLAVSIRPFRTWVAVAGLSGQIERSVSFPTPRRPATLLRQVAKAMEQVRDGESIRQVGVAVPGLVNAATGVISMAPSLPEYANFAIGAEIEELAGVLTLVDNDCSLGALAELWFNSAEVAGLNDFVFLEIGEVGVGAGIILNGALYHGRDGAGLGEFGHMMIHPTGPVCRCGRRGCWERYVSDEATWQRYAPEAKFTPARFDELVRHARKEHEPRALKAFHQTAEYLSLGIANIFFALNPQTVVVAGEITKVWDLLEDTVRSRWATAKLDLRVRPSVMPIDRLSLAGAVALALTPTFGAPRVG